MSKKMAGILVFGGTTEGRLLAEEFRDTGVELHICVATEYGASLIPQSPNIFVHCGRMQEEEIEEMLGELAPEYCLDTTHPYAEDITKNVLQACRKRNTPYIRISRVSEEKSGSGILYFDSIEAVVEYLGLTVGTILITTGSRDLEKYTAIKGYRERCVARVLPTFSVLEKCQSLGFEGRNLIGMQGPFSEELNFCMLKQMQASYLVTKNAGKEGGFQEKCEAALRAGVKVLVVGRPQEPVLGEGERMLDLPEAVLWLKEQYGKVPKRKLYLIGMGPGAQSQLTKEAAECLKSSDVILGAKRLLALCREVSDQPAHSCYRRDEVTAYLQEHPAYRKVALVYSGDIGFYSGAKEFTELEGEYEVHPVSGISSVAYFLNRLLLPWEDVKFVSCHGRKCDLLPLILERKRVCALLGGKEDLDKICREFLALGRLDIQIIVGERLSYPDERIRKGTAEYFLKEEIASLSVVVFENPKPNQSKEMTEIPDEKFVRGKVPMTKQEIRSLSLIKLSLPKDAVLYDIGAGTGTVAVEAALHCREGSVFAVEQNEEGITLIQENRKRFGAFNLTVIKGTAPDCLDGLQSPSHVFIGGSNGRLLDIIRCVREKNKQARFVINAVTLETMAQIPEILKQFPEYDNLEVVQVNIAKGRELGAYHLMMAQNPVCIISFGGGESR